MYAVELSEGFILLSVKYRKDGKPYQSLKLVCGSDVPFTLEVGQIFKYSVYSIVS